MEPIAVADEAQYMPPPSYTDMVEAQLAQAAEEFQGEISPEKMDRELRQIQEDVECWWADRAGGDG